MRESEDESDKDSKSDVRDAHGAYEKDLRLVTVADAPTNKVWVQLATQGSFNHGATDLESGWVGGVLQSVKHCGLVAVGEIELARSAGCEVVGDDFGDFGAEWLTGD